MADFMISANKDETFKLVFLRLIGQHLIANRLNTYLSTFKTLLYTRTDLENSLKKLHLNLNDVEWTNQIKSLENINGEALDETAFQNALKDVSTDLLLTYINYQLLIHTFHHFQLNEPDIENFFEYQNLLDDVFIVIQDEVWFFKPDLDLYVLEEFFLELNENLNQRQSVLNKIVQRTQEDLNDLYTGLKDSFTKKPYFSQYIKNFQTWINTDLSQTYSDLLFPAFFNEAQYKKLLEIDDANNLSLLFS